MSEGRQLIDAYLDGELTSEEQGCFAEWLAADAEHVRQFVRETHVHRQIREAMLARPYRACGLAEDDRAARQAKAAPVRWFGGQLKRLLGFRWSPALGGSIVALTTCLVAVVGVGFWYFGPTMGEPVLAGIQGTGLSLERAGRSLPALAGTRLQAGDILRTPDSVTAALSFASERTLITAQPGTDLKVVATSGAKRFALLAGKLEATVARQRPFRPMVLLTRQAEVRVLGTKFSLRVNTNSTRLEVTEGKVRFIRMSDLRAVSVAAGHYAVTAANYELAALPFTGSILREWWSGVADKTILDLLDDPHFHQQPDGSDMARTLELEAVKTNRVAVRFRGYLHPPASGNYEFWLAGATRAILLMSPNENPAHRIRIGQSGDSVGVREWDHPRAVGQGATQWSSLVPLVAGKRYYIEAILFIEKGEGHLSVAWKRPGASRELLTGEYLSPFKPE